MNLLVPEQLQSKYLRQNGLIVPETYKKKKFPIGIDLFCGAGGMSLGMMQAGVQVIAACDSDVSAAITYTVNLGEHPMQFVFIEPEDEERIEKQLRKEMGYDDKTKNVRSAFVTGSGYIRNHDEVPGCQVFFLGDIRKLTGAQILGAIGMQRGEVDIVCGGPPCQGFSRAGKKNVMDPRNSLVFEFVRLVLEIYPKTMIMENVPDIASMVTPYGVNVIDAICQVLEDGGFGLQDVLKKTLMTSAELHPGMVMRRDKNREKPEQEQTKEEQLRLI